jgi:hypothetical protein
VIKINPINRFGLVLCILFANFVFISPAHAATLFSTISSASCSGYGQTANSLRTAIPFTSPSAANLTGFDLKYSGSATSYMSVKIYNNNAGVNGNTLIGTFNYSSSSGSVASYTGNISLASGTTYWLYFQASSYTTPCYTFSPSTTGSSSGWVVGGRARESFDSGSSWTTRGDALNFLYTIYGDVAAPDTTAPTFTSSSSFSVAENIATSATAATIQVSESATVTISSGADAARFNITRTETNTAIIKFNASPNFEAPVDVGGNNVYNITLTATDTANNAGTQSITITVTDVVDTSSFNSLALVGSATTATFRSSIVITANVSVSSRVTFIVNGKVLPGCKAKLTTGSGSSHSVTCGWKPSNRGAVSLSATAAPTGAGISGATATPVSVAVERRTGAR